MKNKYKLSQLVNVSFTAVNEDNQEVEQNTWGKIIEIRTRENGYSYELDNSLVVPENAISEAYRPVTTRTAKPKVAKKLTATKSKKDKDAVNISAASVQQ